MICGSGGSKSRLPKAAGPEPSGQLQDEKLHDVVAPSQNVQSTPFSDRFRKLTCRKSERRCCAKQIWKSKCTKHTMLGALLEVDMSKKVHAIVAAKRISKSKCTKHTMLEALLEVEMSKKCTQLWQEAHFQVKMWKPHHARNTFGS